MNSPILETISFVKKSLENAEAGHDWWHTDRVWRNAKKIAQLENADTLIVELSALLHDIADSKFHDGDNEIGPRKAYEFLSSIGVNIETIEAVVNTIAQISFHKTFENQDLQLTTEMKIVQDADRLDAIGAIGIARTFHYGGFKNRLLYHPEILPQRYPNSVSYQKNESPTVNHFYEKLLLLKDLFHTQTAKQMAEKRHRLMEIFLENFFEEVAVEPYQNLSI